MKAVQAGHEEVDGKERVESLFVAGVEVVELELLICRPEFGGDAFWRLIVGEDDGVIRLAGVAVGGSARRKDFWWLAYSCARGLFSGGCLWLCALFLL